MLFPMQYSIFRVLRSLKNLKTWKSQGILSDQGVFLHSHCFHSCIVSTRAYPSPWFVEKYLEKCEKCQGIFVKFALKNLEKSGSFLENCPENPVCYIKV